MEVHAARIGKPHGIRGEVSVQLFTDSPEERFILGAFFETDPASNGPLIIRGARWNKSILLLAFEGVTDRNRAEELRGTILLHLAVSEPEGSDEWYEHELLDFTVITQSPAKTAGEQSPAGTPDAPGTPGEEAATTIGKVTALLNRDAQDLLEVTDANGTANLIPFVEEIVPDIDTETRTITINPPPGLLTLNQPDAAHNQRDDQPDGQARGGN